MKTGAGYGWWGARLFACLLLGAASSWTAEIRWQPTLEIARGAGERGPWRQSESRYDFVDWMGSSSAPLG